MNKNYKLKIFQNLDLKSKIMLSKKRINDWYNYFGGKVYVSFSGGKDSTVLLHLVRSLFPEVESVFSDTGLEFPEIRQFVKSIDNVTWVKPKMNFKKVIDKFGYPIISKETSRKIKDLQNPTEKNKKTRMIRLEGSEFKGEKSKTGILSKKWRYLVNAPFKIADNCCDIMKKNPIKKYEKKSSKKPFIGIMAEESNLRVQSYNQNNCNAFNLKRPQSRPIIFWTKKDVWEYIKKFKLSYSKIYDMGYKRTGCVFCGFGCHLEKNENRFQLLYQTHRKLWDYCMREKNGLGMQKVLDAINVESKPNYKLF